MRTSRSELWAESTKRVSMRTGSISSGVPASRHGLTCLDIRHHPAGMHHNAKRAAQQDVCRLRAVLAPMHVLVIDIGVVRAGPNRKGPRLGCGGNEVRQLEL